MSRHVAPHRWADALAGRVHSKQLVKMDNHASACARCALARKEVERTAETFAAIRSQPPPPLGWDSVRARVHWSVSTAKHRRVALATWSGKKALWIGGAVAAAAIAAMFYVGRPSQADRPPSVAPRASLPAPEQSVALVSRLAGDVWIDRVQANSRAAFSQALGAGTVLSTGEGRVDLQFGPASGFALGPRSTLTVARLDAEAIELAVSGVVDVNVGARRSGERFVVVAGHHVIEVRGTRFLVAHDNRGTRVSCHHGLVVVRDQRGGGALEVSAARSAFVATEAVATWNEVKLLPLTAEELAQFTRSAPWTTPIWSPDLVAQSAPLEIAAATKRDVRVDGIELGVAPLLMRIMPGRHTIETADSAGRFRRAGWVDVVPDRGAVFDVVDSSARPTNDSIAKRKKQFAAGIDRIRLGGCTRRLAKSGLTDSVQIEISVDAHGGVNVLNVIDTDLPADTATCVHEVLSDVRFGAGPAATWRDRIDL